MIKRIACPLCGRKLADENGLYQHHHARHQGSPAPKPKRQRQREDDDDMILAEITINASLAEIAIEASIKRAMGEPLDPLEESLLP